MTYVSPPCDGPTATFVHTNQLVATIDVWLENQARNAFCSFVVVDGVGPGFTVP